LNKEKKSVKQVPGCTLYEELMRSKMDKRYGICRGLSGSASLQLDSTWTGINQEYAFVAWEIPQETSKIEKLKAFFALFPCKFQTVVVFIE
jgi:hypothetical protein